MGRHVVRTVGELGEGLVLAPERFNPRRTVAAGGQRLGNLVDLGGENVTAGDFATGARVLVLDTTHAWDGFVLARQAPVAPAELGSAKRALAPGDVIVSRLRPYLRQVAFVDPGLFTRVRGGNAVVASTEFYVLRGRDGFDAAALVPYLLSDTVQAALAAGQEGGHHPRFNRALLAGLPVPRAVTSRAAALAGQVRAGATTLRATLDGGRTLSATVERALKKASVLLVIALALAGCKKKLKDAPQTSAGSQVVPGDPWSGGTPASLPPGAAPQRFPSKPDAPIGRAGPMRVIRAADDGSWVALCETTGDVEQPRLVLGGGEGKAIRQLIAWSDRDLVVNDEQNLRHVDVAAGTTSFLGAVAPVTLDRASRRIVYAWEHFLRVRDPGAADRMIEAGGPVGAIWLTRKRWARVARGTSQDSLGDVDCDHYERGPAYYQGVDNLDLDPAGVEAANRIGPTLGITATGEVTLDGEVVIGNDCIAHVTAVLDAPPRVLANCSGPGASSVLAGPGGFQKRGTSSSTADVTQAGVDENLVMGERMFCGLSSCIDMVTGDLYDYRSHEMVWFEDRTLVRKNGADLWIDVLPEKDGEAARHTELALPRITQAITVDTVTGRRHASPAPTPPRLIDGSGRWLLYGRYLINLHDAVLVTTLAEDAVAVDNVGRILVPAAPGQGPLRWKKP